MKKFYLTLVALFAFTMVATAGVKNLYKQDFEAVNSPAEAGWSSPNLAGGMSLQSTEYGKWFRFSLGANNNRNAVLNFNNGKAADETIFTGQDAKEYTVTFQWGLVANPNDANKPQDVQFSTELALLGGNWNSASKGYFINNGQYATADSLCIFSITQLKGAYSDTNPYWTDNTDNSNYAFDFVVCRDTANATITLAQDMWYDITVTVNTETKTVKWSISELMGEVIKEGESKIADNCDPFVKALNVLMGRRNSIADIDEVKVQMATEGDFANTPSISLTEIDMAKRSFEIYFEDGEILHVKKTEGDEDTAVESPYKYVTETSGTLEVWTENGTATSEHITYEVDATPIALPAASVDITKVNSGYVKTLKMTADNSNVPMQPTITLTWEYSNGDKSAGEVANGATYDATEKGTLTVTTHAYGFVETKVTYENNTEFAIDKTIDFQHMDEETLKAKGFEKIDDLRADKMSGEGNWTARSYLWFGIENGQKNDDGTPKYDTHVVYGPTTNAEAEAIQRYTLAPAKITEEVAKTLFAPVVTWYSATGDGTDIGGMKMNYNIGLINDGIKGGTDKINYVNGPISVDGLTDNDFYTIYLVSDYGGTSEHPIYPEGTSVADGKAMYKDSNIGVAMAANGNQTVNGTATKAGQSLVLKGTDIFGLYRIDTAIARIEIYKSTNTEGIVEIPYNKIVSDHNAPIYNLNGVQVDAKNLKKGVYVKQGKKFVVQ